MRPGSDAAGVPGPGPIATNSRPEHTTLTVAPAPPEITPLVQVPPGPVVPGDQLHLKASYIAVKRNILKFSGEARVDGQLVASAEFMVAELRL